MNPEFQRNVWLELTPLRLIVLVAVLLFAFFAAAVSDGFAEPGTVARWLFDFIVIVWGTRNAARSVVGEIRERTWDGQRLSSLRASTMMVGKLFGATVFNWVGGAICLAVVMAEDVNRGGGLTALADLVYLIALGLIAQAASLLASLIAAGRRQGRSQFEIFLYQIVGIAAAVIAAMIADPSGWGYALFVRADGIVWWGQTVPARGFLLLSLAAFAGWILLADYRLMRLELKLRNGPFVWLAFLVFVTLYAAGFDAWISHQLPLADAAARRLYLAVLVCAVLAYANVLLEPKNRVFFRWLGSELGHARFGATLSRLQCWMMSYAAALVLGLVLTLQLGLSGLAADQAMIGAGLGFMTRDMGLVVLMNVLARRRGGDLLAIAVLILVYALMPSIVGGMQYGTGQALFLPRTTQPLWLSPVLAWLEAVAVWTLAVAKIALPEPAAKD